eukprot:TRINITY_DN63019_c0_g1_i1.p1 TRINITY_DN63019_c0_g1~~TRINITY_DN63019_c0_g1_i1.p1  ORF type:complete len:933 (-),score=229.92 TRINITY_DN63019_c0_g1_i1:79-2877(-)
MSGVRPDSPARAPAFCRFLPGSGLPMPLLLLLVATVLPHAVAVQRQAASQAAHGKVKHALAPNSSSAEEQGQQPVALVEHEVKPVRAAEVFQSLRGLVLHHRSRSAASAAAAAWRASRGAAAASGEGVGPFDVSIGPGSEDSDLSAEAMMGISSNSRGDIWILEGAVIFNGLAWLGCMVSFCILLRLYPVVYKRAPEDKDFEAPPAAPPGFMAKMYFYTQWLPTVRALEPDEAMDLAGLDGLMFLEYHRIMKYLLLVISPTILVVLCPMHYHFGMNTAEIDILSRVGINNLPQGSNCFWVHALFVWYVVAVVVLFILYAQNRFVQLRYRYLGSLPVPHVTTIMVENLPRQYRSDTKLKTFFEQMFGKGCVDRSYVVRRAGVLYDMQRQVEELAKKLEDLKLSGFSAADEPGAGGDGAAAGEGGPRLEASEEAKILESQKEEVEALMESEAQRISSAAAAEDDAAPDAEAPDAAAKALAAAAAIATGALSAASSVVGAGGAAEAKLPTSSATATAAQLEAVQKEEQEQPESMFSGSGFVTFSSRKWRRMALREQFSVYSDEFVTSLAPDPNDVYYGNLALAPSERMNLDLVGRLSMVGIFITWFPAVIFISGFTSLRSLQDRSPYIAALCERQPALEAVLEGVLSTLVLKLFMGLLPTLFLMIFREFFSIESGAMAQYHMQHWFYAFNIFFIVLVTAVGRSLLATAETVARDPGELFELLALSLPTASHFYLQYVVLGWFSVALEQLRTSNLFKYMAFRVFYSPEQAKEKSEPEADTTYGMGSRFARASTYSAIMLVFCTCSPLICLLTLVYFWVGGITYTYLLCFAETRKPDLGGLFWVQALRQMFVGLLLFVLLMVGVLEERAATVKPGLFAAGSLVLLYWGWLRLNSFNWRERTLPEEVKDDLHDKQSPPAPVGQYVQPVLQTASDEKQP